MTIALYTSLDNNCVKYTLTLGEPGRGSMGLMKLSNGS